MALKIDGINHTGSDPDHAASDATRTAKSRKGKGKLSLSGAPVNGQAPAAKKKAPPKSAGDAVSAALDEFGF